MMEFIEKIHAAGGETFEVGGTLRDSLLGRPHKDRDLLVTRLSLPKLRKLLKPLGQIHEVGKSFGVLKFRPAEESIEYDIALPRVEKSTGPKHRDFDVQFDASLPVEMDLQRRDFTINAMARNIRTGKIVDPFGGRKDLEQGLLRQVFSEAFEEDPLRLLRAIQFAARFELTLEPETLVSLKKHAALITSVSPERIILEIGKLFQSVRPSHGFYLMKETGLLKHVFPELERTIGVEQPNKRTGDVFDHTMMVLDASRSCRDLDTPGDLEIMFASLFHDVGKPDTKGYDPVQKRITFYGHQVISTRMAKKWLHKYRANMLGINIENVLSLVYNHMFETKSFYTEKAIRRFIQKIGKELIFKLIDLRIADKKGGAFPNKIRGVVKLKEKILEEINRKAPFGPKDLAINGYDLMEMGYPKGPLMGTILKALVEVVLDEPALNTRESLVNYVLKEFPLTGGKDDAHVREERAQP